MGILTHYNATLDGNAIGRWHLCHNDILIDIYCYRDQQSGISQEMDTSDEKIMSQVHFDEESALGIS